MPGYLSPLEPRLGTPELAELCQVLTEVAEAIEGKRGPEKVGIPASLASREIPEFLPWEGDGFEEQVRQVLDNYRFLEGAIEDALAARSPSKKYWRKKKSESLISEIETLKESERVIAASLRGFVGAFGNNGMSPLGIYEEIASNPRRGASLEKVSRQFKGPLYFFEGSAVELVRLSVGRAYGPPENY